MARGACAVERRVTGRRHLVLATAVAVSCIRRLPRRRCPGARLFPHHHRRKRPPYQLAGARLQRELRRA